MPGPAAAQIAGLVLDRRGRVATGFTGAAAATRPPSDMKFNCNPVFRVTGARLGLPASPCRVCRRLLSVAGREGRAWMARPGHYRPGPFRPSGPPEARTESEPRGCPTRRPGRAPSTVTPYSPRPTGTGTSQHSKHPARLGMTAVTDGRVRRVGLEQVAQILVIRCVLRPVIHGVLRCQ